MDVTSFCANEFRVNSMMEETQAAIFPNFEEFIVAVISFYSDGA